MERILKSLWFVVSTPPVVPSDLSSKSVEQLTSLRQALSPFRNADLHLLFWATVFVTIGVLMEVAEIQHDARDAVREIKHQNRLGELNPWWKFIVALGWILVAFGLGAEWIGDARINSVDIDLDRIDQVIVHRTEGEAIAAGHVAAMASTDAGNATTKAGLANTVAAKAEGRASNALTLARGARHEADSFKADISSAEERAASAEEQAAKAESNFATAEAEVYRLKTDRSLTDLSLFVRRLQPFEGTKYAFFGVFDDPESLKLLKQIDAALTGAGWTRVASPIQTPGAISLPIAEGIKVQEVTVSGVAVDVQSTETSEALNAMPPVMQPGYIKAASALKSQLFLGIDPQQEDLKNPVELSPGTASVVFIIVGKKP